MIGRVGAAAGALAAPTIAQAAREPEVWQLLGYHFYAAGMIAAVFGCICARLWLGARQVARRQHFRWTLDVPISAMTFGSTVVLVLTVSPAPWLGLLYGAGLGVIGEGLFRLAEKVLRATGMVGDADEAEPKA